MLQNDALWAHRICRLVKMVATWEGYVSNIVDVCEILHQLIGVLKRPSTYRLSTIQGIYSSTQSEQNEQGKDLLHENGSCESIHTGQKSVNLARHGKTKGGAHAAQSPDPWGFNLFTAGQKPLRGIPTIHLLYRLMTGKHNWQWVLTLVHLGPCSSWKLGFFEWV